ncbi:MAG: hypothetical protein IT292_09780 [Deltaproteobacteria bacterium]|nr:hypothetical protein [Deltaproteobacteria bacterium]
MRAESLLNSLLAILDKEGSTITQIAAVLGTSCDLIEMLLNELKNMGYVEEIQSGCSSCPASCSIKANCAPERQSKIWCKILSNPA